MSTVITGIYSITNLTNGKRYIGKSLSIHSRWSQHRRDLKKGIHHSGFLQNAWNKYGEDNFAEASRRALQDMIADLNKGKAES